MIRQELYTVREISDALGVSQTFVRNECQRGYLIRSPFLQGRIRGHDMDAWMKLRDAEIRRATEFLGSDDARLVQLELWGRLADR